MAEELQPPVRDGFVFGWHLLSKPDTTSFSAYDADEAIGAPMGQVISMPEHQAQRLLYRMHDETDMRPMSEIIRRSLPPR